MTAEQLGQRMGLGKARIYQLERSEVSGSITLQALESAAHALDCQVVYALVPRHPLQETVEARARITATEHVRALGHTMMLEDQAVNPDELRDQIDELTRELLSKSGSGLWDEP